MGDGVCVTLIVYDRSNLSIGSIVETMRGAYVVDVTDDGPAGWLRQHGCALESKGWRQVRCSRLKMRLSGRRSEMISLRSNLALSGRRRTVDPAG